MSTSGDCPDTSLFWSACRKAGFEPRVPFELDDYNAIQGFVAAGMGVAVIPEVALKAIRDDVVVRPISPKPRAGAGLSPRNGGANSRRRRGASRRASGWPTRCRNSNRCRICSAGS